MQFSCENVQVTKCSDHTFHDKEMYPLITIVTVVLNDKNNIGKTIDSVSSIIYPNIEYIVIDGGSTDGTVDVIRENDKKITKWISESDGGIFHAMNKGAMLANGRYINFLNSGDRHMPDFMSHDFKEWKKNNIEYCHSNLLLTRNDKNVGVARPYLNKKRLHLHLGSPFLHPTILVSLSAFSEIGFFNTQFKLAADHDWVLKLINSKKNGIYIDRSLTYFDDNGASNNLNATKESKSILISNGLNPFFASVIYALFLIKKFAKSIIKYRNES